jgi:hypothetical protein
VAAPHGGNAHHVPERRAFAGQCRRPHRKCLRKRTLAANHPGTVAPRGAACAGGEQPADQDRPAAAASGDRRGARAQALTVAAPRRRSRRPSRR